MKSKIKPEVPPASDLPRFRPGQSVVWSGKTGLTAGRVMRLYHRGEGSMGRASFWGLPAFEGQDTAWGVSLGATWRNGRRALGALVTLPDSRLVAQ